MAEMFLNYLLLNVPEGIIVTALSFKDYSFKDNKRNYICAVIYSSLIIYIVPEIFGFLVYYQLILMTLLTILFKFGYNISLKNSAFSSFLYFAILGISQTPLCILIKNTLGIQNYMNLSPFFRFVILFPNRIFELYLAIKFRKEVFKMKKGFFIGKTAQRNRGEKA